MVNALKANELLYLSMLCGADEVFGIPDVFHGKTEDEIRAFIDETSKSCAEKSLYIADFEGENALCDSIGHTIRIIASADIATELILRNTKSRQQRYLIYSKGNERAILLESGGEYFIAEEMDLKKIHTGLQILFAKGCLLQAETDMFTVGQGELAEIYTGVKVKAAAMRALMREQCVDEMTALLMSEGLSGRAGYFSGTTINRVNNRMKTAFFLADSGIVLQLSTDEKRNLNITAAESEAAMQIALSYAGGDFYV